MNHIILAGKVLSHQIRHTQNQKTLCETFLEWNCGTPKEPKLSKLKIATWEKLGDRFHTEHPEGSSVIVEGIAEVASIQRTDGVKQSVLTVTVQRFLPGSAGLQLCNLSIVGRCGQDPEVRYFESGAVKTTITIAVNKRTRNKDEPPNWFNLEAWSSTAQVMADYVRKGSQIGINGTIKIETWQDRETGHDRWKPIVLVRDLELLEKAAES
jgi:single-strand DNA-binding protein